MEEYGKIQAVLRVVPLNARSTYWQMTKEWPSGRFNEALDMVETYGHRTYQQQTIELLKELRQERLDDERSTRAEAATQRNAMNPDIDSKSPRGRLLAHAERGKQLQADNTDGLPARYDAWYTAGRRLLQDLYGSEAPELDSFAFVFSTQGNWHLQARRALAQLIKSLGAMAEFAPEGATQPKPSASAPWAGIHPDVVRVSKALFESKHGAEAVRAAVVELNNRVKVAFKNKTGTELDGLSLMGDAFGKSGPFRFADESDTTNKNFHDGHLMLIKGAVDGLRNPLSHKNTELDSAEALELLHFLSYMNRVLDRRLPRGTP